MKTQSTIKYNGVETTVTYGEVPFAGRSQKPAQTPPRPDERGLFEPVKPGHISVAQLSVFIALRQEGLKVPDARRIVLDPTFFNNLAAEGVASIADLHSKLSED